MYLIPQNEILVTEKVEVEQKSKSGLYLGAADESPPLFKVVETNSNYTQYEYGDRLLISASPPKAKFDGKEYFFVNVDTVLAIYRD